MKKYLPAILGVFILGGVAIAGEIVDWTHYEKIYMPDIQVDDLLGGSNELFGVYDNPGADVVYFTSMTTDGTDNAYVLLGNGEYGGITRGGTIELYGNEHSVSPAALRLKGGAMATGEVRLWTSHDDADISFGGGTTPAEHWSIDGANGMLVPAANVKLQMGVSGTILEIPNGTDLPATCAVGEIFIDSDDDACADGGGGTGAMCACLAVDTWAEVS